MGFLLTLFLLFPIVALAGQGMIPSAIPYVAGGGPNTWYYACTATPASEPSWAGNYNSVNTEAKCSPWTVSQGGTVTQLSFKGGENGNIATKIAIYDTSGNKLSDGCTISNSFQTDTWVDCNLGTPYVITAGSYDICYMNASSNYYQKYVAINSSYQPSLDYASFPYTSLTYSEYTGKCFAVRGFVQ